MNFQKAEYRSPFLNQIDRVSAIDIACKLVAPSWPLDRFIAVNPFWGWIDRHFDEVASSLRRLNGTHMWMPLTFYNDAIKSGAISLNSLEQALKDSLSEDSVEDILLFLQNSEKLIPKIELPSDKMNPRSQSGITMSFIESITHEVSQLCASYFDVYQSDWHPSKKHSLFEYWIESIISDNRFDSFTDVRNLRESALSLPSSPRAAINFIMQELKVPNEDEPLFMYAVLSRINGWAAWCAYLRWEAELKQETDDHIVHLLAIKLSWEFICARSIDNEKPQQVTTIKNKLGDRIRDEHRLSLLHRALEMTYQNQISLELLQTVVSEHSLPKFQAVFCIDVRSEIFRRKLEETCPSIHTIGFAGFFGLPVSYQPIGTSINRPQLPGLLYPSMQIKESCGCSDTDKKIIQLRKARLNAVRSLTPFKKLPGSAFTLVEALGLGYFSKLIQQNFPSAVDYSSLDHQGLSKKQKAILKPALSFTGTNILKQKTDLAEKVLRGMNLTENFSRLIVLISHGSQSKNNPHAAGLDCGACCGQTGELNARALAFLLNETEVRKQLQVRGILIPESSIVIPGMHITTTDEILLFDTENIPPSHAKDLDDFKSALQTAANLTRQERAPNLGLSHLIKKPKHLHAAIRKRANDWAQTRPEWGLANNAAFIVAPRTRTLGKDLKGRCFLHEYDWKKDTDLSILELIMTAPMVVANWINMQYYASTVDNTRLGSGNKVLHNVVGGNIGVFEGNGGDLRIGLAKQSLHDGTKWIHNPLRLSVFIEAPKSALEKIINKHKTVSQLIENQWLYLFQINSESSRILRYNKGEWENMQHTKKNYSSDN